MGTHAGGELVEKLPAVTQITAEPKRSHQWFLDAGEMELFPNKKQAVQVPSGSLPAEPVIQNVPIWQNSSGFPSISNQYIDQLFGSDARPDSFADRNISLVGGDNFSMGRKEIDSEVANDASVGLTMSRMSEDAETSFSYGGIRKVKVNQVMDSDNGIQAAKEGHYFGEGSEINFPFVHSANSKSPTNFISMGQPYGKMDHEIVLMGHTYARSDVQIRQPDHVFEKGDGHAISMTPVYQEDTGLSSFSNLNNQPNINPVEIPVSRYFCDQPLVCGSETPTQKELGPSPNTAASASLAAKARPESVSRSKPEAKSSKKEDRNRFPSNVRSLISTGIFDGVPVKYISVSKEELNGIIKDAGYLCGCQSCNYSKVLNAYEFERHAGCKSKHPNNHIYFESGKTIYGIVQELRGTPESLLFDAIQTITGSPINQKSFRVWKESFLAATRELQRIYGKEELN